MSNLDELLRNNAIFAATGAKDRVPEIPFIPNKQVYILTCIDPRVDPAQVFGLELGDAIVARTVGGRVTPAVIQDLAWISYLHETKTPDADWFELAVMHHTDCGSGFSTRRRSHPRSRSRVTPTMSRPAWSPPSCRREDARAADPRAADHHLSGPRPTYGFR